jgi:hypothetical protein
MSRPNLIPGNPLSRQLLWLLFWLGVAAVVLVDAAMFAHL